MFVRTIKRVAPTGVIISVDLPDDSPTGAVSTGVRFSGGSYHRGFQIGTRGYHTFLCKHAMPGAEAVEKVIVGGREVVIAESSEGSVATLIGDYNELSTAFYGPRPSSDVVKNLFSVLKITDSVHGMRVTASDPTMLEMVGMTISIEIEGRGSIFVPHGSFAKAMLPAFRGQPTQHGELWKTVLPDVSDPSQARDFSYLLGCPGGLSEIYLDDTSTADDATLLGWLDGLKVTIPGY